MGILHTSVKRIINNVTCTRKRLSAYTDQFTIVIKLEELAAADPTDANIVLKFKTEQNRVIHFFKWQFQSVWSSNIDSNQGSYSMLKGLMVPQTVYKDNLNITTAFRGPDPTVISFMLTPTYYSDEINAENVEGYRVHHRGFKRGSVVNERTLTNLYTYDGRYSEDFIIKFETEVSSNVYNVRVIRLRTIIDVATQVLGLLAGLAFICRFAKFLLMKCNVWLHLDREYNVYFKDDKRMSVTLNPPSQKPPPGTTDLWEANYPYSNKNVGLDTFGNIVVRPEVTDGFGAMLRMHNNQNKESTSELQDANKANANKYEKMEDEEDDTEKNK